MPETSFPVGELRDPTLNSSDEDAASYSSIKPSTAVHDDF